VTAARGKTSLFCYDVDAIGATVESYLTDAFGTPQQTQGPQVTQSFQFTGEQRDPTGLIYLRARFYDPAIGHLISRDPFAGVIRTPLSLNRYSYALNNPVNGGAFQGCPAPR